tara:strand:- start:575 stop:712 length:138 start_codon:yes stop_codon:yes gene_type:complete
MIQRTFTILKDALMEYLGAFEPLVLDVIIVLEFLVLTLAKIIAFE